LWTPVHFLNLEGLFRKAKTPPKRGLCEKAARQKAYSIRQTSSSRCDFTPRRSLEMENASARTGISDLARS